MEKLIKFKILGMDADSDVSAIDNTMSRDNLNIRFTNTADGEGDLAITNEKGTLLVNDINLDGTVIGLETIDDYVVLFTTKDTEDPNDKLDYIYILKNIEEGVGENVQIKLSHYYTYKGNFNFSKNNPIECQKSYERQDLKKVYWVDGKNQLRYLTIPDIAEYKEKLVLDSYFDTIRPLPPNAASLIDINKIDYGGTFPVGVIQYAFTFYNKFGSESNIFKMTPLMYVSNGPSGAPSDRSMSCAFTISISEDIKDVSKDYLWEYLRVYSIQRTALNGEPTCKRVVDILIEDITKDLLYTDTGEHGEIIDSTRLLYVGGEQIIPKTISQKDGTLFLGNYTVNRKELSATVKDILKKAYSKNNGYDNSNFFNVYYEKYSTLQSEIEDPLLSSTLKSRDTKTKFPIQFPNNGVLGKPVTITPSKDNTSVYEYEGIKYKFNPRSVLDTLDSCNSTDRVIYIPEVTIVGANTTDKLYRIVDGIGDFAFKGNTNILQIEIPSTVRTIGQQAFYECHNLDTLVIKKDTPPTCSGSISDNSNLIVKVPKNSINAYKNAYYFKNFTIRSIEDDDSSTTTDDATYIEYSDIGTKLIFKLNKKDHTAKIIGTNSRFSTSSSDPSGNFTYTLPSSVQYKENETFTTYTVTGVGSRAFANKLILELTIPGNIEYLEDEAFADVKLLISVSGANNVKKVGRKIFEGTDYFKVLKVGREGPYYLGKVYLGYLGTPTDPTLTLKENTVAIAGGAFESSTFKEVVLPETSLEHIGKYAFYNCQNLTTITIPESVKAIDDLAFVNCIRLTNLTINGNPTFGKNVFYNCSALTNVKIDSITDIGDAMFANCSRLKSISFNKAKTIGKNSFSKCEILENINISPTVRHIKEEAFSNCTKLNTVSFTSDGKLNDYLTNDSYLIVIDINAFKGCNNITKVSVTDESESFWWVQGIKFSNDLSNPLAINKSNSELIINGNANWYNNTVFNNVKNIEAYSLIGQNYLYSVTIDSNTLHSIKTLAFAYCSNLSSVTIKEVTTINDYAFYNTNLSTLTFNQEAPIPASYGIVQYPSKVSLIVPENLENLYLNHSYYKLFSKINDKTPDITQDSEPPTPDYYARKAITIIKNESDLSSSYSYTPLLNMSHNQISTFKSNETYRIGIQLLDDKGRWSEPIFLFDCTNKAYPRYLDNSQQYYKYEDDITNKKHLTFNPNYLPIPGIEIGEILGLEGETDINNKTTVNSALNIEVVDSYLLALLPFGHLHIDKNIWELEIPDTNTTLINYIKDLGYTKIRPVIVLPAENEREVLFLGVANPTIVKTAAIPLPLNIFDPLIDITYTIPSWYYRAIPSNNALDYDKYKNGNYSLVNLRNHPAYLHRAKLAYYYGGGDNLNAEFNYELNCGFYVNWDVLTIDSPDIMFNQQLSLADLKNTKMRVVGYVDLLGNLADYTVTVEGGMEVLYQSKNDPWIYSAPFREKIKLNSLLLSSPIDSNNFGGGLINYPLWVESISIKGNEDNSENVQSGEIDKDYSWLGLYRSGSYRNAIAQWYVYPWHRSGSLNNCASSHYTNVAGAERPSMLKRKIFANSRFGFTTLYDTIKCYYEPDNSLKSGVTDSSFDLRTIKVFNQKSENQITKLYDGTAFKNNVDSVLPALGYPSFRVLGDVNNNGIRLKYFGLYSPSNDPNTLKRFPVFLHNVLTHMFTDLSKNWFDAHVDMKNDGYGGDDGYLDSSLSSDPIPFLFRTGSNCVIELSPKKDASGEVYRNLLILPYNHLQLSSNNNALINDKATGYWLPIVEIYKEQINKFGGISEDALKQNAWIVAGQPVDLEIGNTIFWDCGDTYFLRYDCLKTYPWSDSSKNNIVEVLSFMCETHINIDGRYDLNRGTQDNTTLTENNFNQLNDVYTQKDNYFEYYIGDESLTLLSSYPNQVIWSMTKKSGDEIDAWTNITLLNYLDLDGDKGEIRAIKNFNNQLVVFLDSGISLLKYNLDVLLNQQEGVPIEIANSGKVTGSTYLSTNQGCISKWSIIDVSEGLVFIDALNKKFNLFNGREITDLGEKAKFQSWVKEKCGSLKEWTPEWLNEDTVTLLYDKLVNEILIVGKDFTAAYNLGTFRFTSFYSYDATPWLIHTGNKSLLVHKDLDTNWKLWSIREGDYNKFFNEIEPFKIKLVANDTKDFDSMKLFSTLEIRDNVLASTENGLLNIYAFDKIKVDNSYQSSAEETLTYERNKPSNLKPKFRTWRIKIPRAASNNKGRIKDRMMDHYLNVELIHDNEDTNQIKIHDIIAKYIV